MIDVVTALGANRRNDLSFDSFVVGSSNRLAYQAAVSIVQRYSPVYNPLFIYSGSGRGKTHLLRVMEQRCVDAGLAARYMTAGQFVRQFIAAIQTDCTEQFRQGFCNLDVLLLDDLQCISGKPQTQEEIFHIFNCLHQPGKQMVFAADRPPQALALVEDRLRSRFEWGLVAGIQPPDFATRVAILKDKAQRLGISIDYSALESIASAERGNVPEMLTQLVQAADCSPAHI